jgi:hypothetical protein
VGLKETLKETLSEMNNVFCEKMGMIFSTVMEKAADREEKNIEKLTLAGHEDVATILAGMKDIFNK